MSAYEIRPYQPSDRAAVRAVCWQTAFMGSSIAFLYRDAESWADLYTSYYTDAEPENAWVVEGADRQVVGYLLGCVDARQRWSEERIALRLHMTRFLWARPGTASFWWRAAWDLVREAGRIRAAVDYARFPADLHLNLLPEARSQGVGLALLRRYRELLVARGVPGIHGETLASNATVHRLLAKIGFEKAGVPYAVPGLRTRAGERVYGQLVLCDLRHGVDEGSAP